MRILVVGAGFANKGAEAMVLSVRDQLSRRISDLELLVWDCPTTHEDAAREAGIVPISRPRLPGRAAKIAWILGQIATHGGLKLSHARNPATLWPDFSALPMLEAAGKVDAMIDISGFAYGDVWGPKPALSVLPLVRNMRDRSLPIVFMPQAWGGFDKPDVREAVRDLTCGPKTMVFSRDSRSTRHLEATGLAAGSVATRADIVFAFDGGSEELGRTLLEAMGCGLDRPVVGVSPNMRIYERSVGEGPDNEYVQGLVGLVRHCVDQHDVDVVLLPFECAPVDRGKDDRRLCAMVRERVQRESRCHTAADYLTAEGARSIVGTCEYLVGSRFHSLVFALSQGVPCTAVGWSHKYTELMTLFESVEDCVAHGEVNERELVGLFEAGWARRADRRERNLQIAAELRADTDSLFDEVASFLMRGGSRDG